MKDFSITIKSRASANAVYLLAAVVSRVALVPVVFKALVNDGAEGILLEHGKDRAELFGYGSIKRNKFKIYREGLEVQEWARKCYEHDSAKRTSGCIPAEVVLAGTEKDVRRVRLGRKHGTKAALARAGSLSMRKKQKIGRNIHFATLHPAAFRLEQGRMFHVAGQ